jgi:hypothetical protein
VTGEGNFLSLTPLVYVLLPHMSYPCNGHEVALVACPNTIVGTMGQTGYP